MPFAKDGQEKWFAGYTKDTTLQEIRDDIEKALPFDKLKRELIDTCSQENSEKRGFFAPYRAFCDSLEGLSDVEKEKKQREFKENALNQTVAYLWRQKYPFDGFQQAQTLHDAIYTALTKAGPVSDAFYFAFLAKSPIRTDADLENNCIVRGDTSYKLTSIGAYTFTANAYRYLIGAERSYATPDCSGNRATAVDSPGRTFLTDEFFPHISGLVTLEDVVTFLTTDYSKALRSTNFYVKRDNTKAVQGKTVMLKKGGRLNDLIEFISGGNRHFEGDEVQNSAMKEGNGMENSTVQQLLANLFDNAQNACKQVILTGAPGTGKTYGARAYAQAQGGEVQFVQFHPAYDYADFVEGLRPITQGGSPTFVRMDGIFKAFCRKIVEENRWYAEENVPPKKYFFLIDEINRADLGRVFGELMFGLEENYRGPENRIHTPYENLPCYDRTGCALANDVFADGFYIPENLYIIGTMNDIDRSVESFDFALRRRFRWLNVRAGAVMEQTLQTMAQADGRMSAYIPELVQRIAALNDYIAAPEGGGKFGLTEDYQIGPAYFKGVYDDRQLGNAFTNRIEPLLREYLRGRRSEDVNAFLEQCRNCLNAMN